MGHINTVSHGQARGIWICSVTCLPPVPCKVVSKEASYLEFGFFAGCPVWRWKVTEASREICITSLLVDEEEVDVC